jgi:hypothetical protein
MRGDGFAVHRGFWNLEPGSTRLHLPFSLIDCELMLAHGVPSAPTHFFGNEYCRSGNWFAGARCQSAFKCIVMDWSTLMLTSLISLYILISGR